MSPQHVERLRLTESCHLPKFYYKVVRETRMTRSKLCVQPSLSSPTAGPARAWPGLHTVWVRRGCAAESLPACLSTISWV